MIELLTLIETHGAEILAYLGIGYLLLSVFVAMTPTKDDDEALSRLRAALERLSFLQPRDGVGVFSLPMQKAKRRTDLESLLSTMTPASVYIPGRGELRWADLTPEEREELSISKRFGGGK